MIRVVTHQSWEVERGREARLPLRKQIAKPLIRILGGAKSRELPHGPQTPAMHRRVNSSRVRRFARLTEVYVGIPTRQIRGSVKPPNRMRGYRGERRLSFGTLRERGLQRILFPCDFFCGGLSRRTGFGGRDSPRFFPTRIAHN